MLAFLQGILVLAMKTTKGLFGFFAAIVLLSVNRLFAQAPPNDNFDNRTVLNGSVATLSGYLGGATLESGETSGPNYWMASGASGSVWWSWTAPASSTVVIAMSSPTTSYNRLGVYTGNTLNTLTLQTYTYFAKP